jgi:ABC-2 type transport system ATP-binding protein
MTSLDGNVYLTDELKDRVRKSDIFVMILSQGYIHSSWCLEELKIFREENIKFNRESNIFIIQKDNIPLKKRPKEIEDIIGYNFWYTDLNGTIRTLFKDKKEKYYSLIAQMIDDMGRYLLSPIKMRQAEIEKYLQYNDLDMATKRSMDFANDFSEIEDKKRAIKIRETFNRLKEIGMQQPSTQLQEEIFGFISTIEREFKPKKQVSTKENFLEAKERFQGDRETIFRAINITKLYPNFTLKPISLELKYGEITALVGENGNGKTTLLNIIAGKILHSNGTIEYPFLTDKKSDWYHIKNQIAYITQELPKWRGLLKDNLHFTLGVNGIKGQKNIDDVNFIIHRLGLEKYANAKWSEISGGFKMRFALAKAILRKPKLLILDEPLANLDISTQNLFLNDLKDISRSIKDKISVILSSQNIYDIKEIADNIIFLSNGESLYKATPRE